MGARVPSTDFLMQVKSCLQAAFAGRFRGVVLYGSEARGTAREGSDIDLLVLLRGPVRLGDDAWTAVRATYALELDQDPIRPLSLLPVDADDYARQASPLYVQAAREGLVL